MVSIAPQPKPIIIPKLILILISLLINPTFESYLYCYSFAQSNEILTSIAKEHKFKQFKGDKKYIKFHYIIPIKYYIVHTFTFFRLFKNIKN